LTTVQPLPPLEGTRETRELSALRERLKRAILSAGSSEQALVALAHLEPGAALSWLLLEERAARASWPGDTLAQLLGTIVDLALARHGVARAGELTTLLRRYADVARAGTVASLASVLPLAERGRELEELLAAVAKREPHDPALLRAAAEQAVRDGDAARAHPLLTQLARAEDSQATIHYVYRIRRSLPSPSVPSLPVVRSALLSSFSVDALVPYVDLELRALGLVPELYVAPFNSWAQEILTEDSQLHRFSPEIAFLAVSIDDLLPELAGAATTAELEGKGIGAVERVTGVARRFADMSDAVLVVHSFHSAYRSPLGILEGRAATARSLWLDQLNQRLAEELKPLPRTYLLDMRDLLMRRPGGALDNPKMRYLAAMRLGDQVLGEVARAYARYVAPLKGLTRKCVVLDLDNTLWGGTVGEDGMHGIQLGNTSPGAEYQDFQRYLLSLTERGILLAINSKNNLDDAIEVIRLHEGMILREEKFSAQRINWRPKAENMLSIAEELNLGVDQMVFVDDSPEERELMRQMLPQVLTPDLPHDPSRYRDTIEVLPQLQTLLVTEEDRTRVEQYRSMRQRQLGREKAPSIEAHLHSLDIQVKVELADVATLSRVHQLFQRTNQFNLTTRRYDAGEIAAIARDPGCRLYALRARDCFGDHGLVAAVLVRSEADRWILDSFLMSCRVIGYGVETAFLAAVVADARSQSIRSLIGEYIPTQKNGPARDFYSRHGFMAETQLAEVTRWRLDLSALGAQVECPAWIKMETNHGP